ncbi:MFS transporter [Cellulomonas sp. P4]|uniref:MFS transporter n=1 Tax=Cellulomonas sp. P4 TaxID=3142533 RepID=UPI0031B9F32B
MPTPTDTRPTPDLRGALAALIVGGIAAILDSTMVALAIHTLSLELGATSADIQWVSTSYLLAIAVAIPVTGWVESRWGGKRAWAAALLVFVTGRCCARSPGACRA